MVSRFGVKLDRLKGVSIPKSVRVQIKRAYEAASPEDGGRYLVDRLWPRGVTRDALACVGWLKDLAPSDELRRWFGHDPKRWVEFRRRYRTELRSKSTALQPLLEAVSRGPVTLVYSAHDEAHNQAVVLREFLLERLSVPTRLHPGSKANQGLVKSESSQTV